MKEIILAVVFFTYVGFTFYQSNALFEKQQQVEYMQYKLAVCSERGSK